MTLDLVEIQDSQAPRYVPSSWQYGMGSKAAVLWRYPTRRLQEELGALEQESGLH